MLDTPTDKWLSPKDAIQTIHAAVEGTSPQAIINHIPLYTNKKIISGNNYQVTFSDGSWCDISTGDIMNRGPGYIYIGFPHAIGKEHIVEGPHNYAAQSIIVRDADIDFHVEVGAIQTIQLTLIGIPEDIQHIHISVQDGICFIEGVIQSDILPNGIILTTGMRSMDLKVHVVVPPDTPITTTNILGYTHITGVRGLLNLTANAADIFIDQTTNAILSVNGSANIHVNELNGASVLSVNGSGSIRVNGGSLTQLQGSVTGSGSILFNGTAQDADLMLLGTGVIHVRHMQNQPLINRKGSGTITIGH